MMVLTKTLACLLLLEQKWESAFSQWGFKLTCTKQILLASLVSTFGPNIAVIVKFFDKGSIILILKFEL